MDLDLSKAQMAPFSKGAFRGNCGWPEGCTKPSQFHSYLYLGSHGRLIETCTAHTPEPSGAYRLNPQFRARVDNNPVIKVIKRILFYESLRQYLQREGLLGENEHCNDSEIWRHFVASQEPQKAQDAAKPTKAKKPGRAAKRAVAKPEQEK